MTTICYKAGIIAYDSRATAGGVIVDDEADKMTVARGVRFFIAGSPADFDRFLDIYFGESDTPVDIDLCGFAVESGGALYKFGVNKNDGLWKQPHRAGCAAAIGSGGEFALGAMDCGLSAKEAVKVAMKRDTGTGGRIRTFKL